MGVIGLSSTDQFTRALAGSVVMEWVRGSVRGWGSRRYLCGARGVSHGLQEAVVRRGDV